LVNDRRDAQIPFCVVWLQPHHRNNHFRPEHDTATNTERQLPGVVLTQFVSPDDERDVLETRRELKIKINT